MLTVLPLQSPASKRRRERAPLIANKQASSTNTTCPHDRIPFEQRNPNCPQFGKKKTTTKEPPTEMRYKGGRTNYTHARTRTPGFTSPCPGFTLKIWNLGSHTRTRTRTQKQGASVLQFSRVPHGKRRFPCDQSGSWRGCLWERRRERRTRSVRQAAG